MSFDDVLFKRKYEHIMQRNNMANKLAIGGTLFPYKGCHKETWISPDGKTQNQIDHIAISHKWKSSLQDFRVKRKKERKKGRKEGRKEGRKKERKKERKKGRKGGRKEGRKQGRKETRKKERSCTLSKYAVSKQVTK